MRKSTSAKSKFIELNQKIRKRASIISEDLPTTLTVAYLVGLPLTASCGEDGSSSSSEEDELPPWKENTKAALSAYLKENGCPIAEEFNDDGTKEAVLLEAAKRIAYEPSFWPKHAPLHPNAGRVKPWLWVHSRFRSQAESLLQHLGSLPEKEEGEEDSVAFSINSELESNKEESKEDSQSRAPTDEPDYAMIWKKTAAAFRKLQRKIQAHSDFEDEQLFRYFVDHHTKAGGKDRLTENLARLHGQHTDLRVVEDIQTILDDESISKRLETQREIDPVQADSLPFEQLRPLLESYVHDLKEHLRLEEETLVRPWLQLTEEEYKQYRSYLSWKSCIMY